MADTLAKTISKMGAPIDRDLVVAGALLHDAGKIVCTSELSESGQSHTEIGEKLLVDNGVAPELARVCVSHKYWDSDGVSTEELVVALADRLWKGKRNGRLEARIVERAARTSLQEPLSVFLALDAVFEKIADEAPERLRVARGYV